MKNLMTSRRVRKTRTLILGLVTTIALVAAPAPGAAAEDTDIPIPAEAGVPDESGDTDIPVPAEAEAGVPDDEPAVPDGAIHPESIDDGTSELDHADAPVDAGAVAGGAGRAEVRDIAFPVLGPVNYTDTYGSPRGGGRLHIGTDIMSDKLQEVVAVDDGVIFWVSYGGSNYIYLRGDDGYI